MGIRRFSKKKWLFRFFNLKWMYFYKINGQDMPFKLVIRVRKIMTFRWQTSSWMQFSILRLKSSIARANSFWSIVSTSCRMASFNSFKLLGFWVYTRTLRYPQRHTAQAPMNVLRNMFLRRLISRFRHVPWAVTQCWLYLEAEAFVFQFAIQKF